jgi:hypothetical protein
MRTSREAGSNVTQGSHAHKGIARLRARRRARTASTVSDEAASIPPLVKTEKTFRLEEANAIVPRLQILMERLQRGALRLHEEMSDLARVTGVEPAALSAEHLLRERPAARVLVEELDSIVHEIEESGAHLKDVELGLVDFPAERDGEIVYLCWQFGEPEIAFWHRVDEGFAGRQPLPGSTRPPYLQ